VLHPDLVPRELSHQCRRYTPVIATDRDQSRSVSLRINKNADRDATLRLLTIYQPNRREKLQFFRTDMRIEHVLPLLLRTRLRRTCLRHACVPASLREIFPGLPRLLGGPTTTIITCWRLTHLPP
jgi:hypothetical protein